MIAFSCSQCGMKFSVKEEFAGRSTKCATCKQPLTVPQPVNNTMGPIAVGQIKGTPSSLNRAGVPATMTLCPPRNDALPPGQKSVTQLLASHADCGERYVFESEIARGGMGAVLRAVDCDIRREVAVKYMLDQSDPRKKLRFIEEAQITGQLEHPNIVPIHELGVDPQDKLFFSMKMVKGRSLAEIITELKDAPRFAERQYPLSRLLTVFVGVCNALAYAHSRGVVHRDLKPANIMVGDFGEVYVMDWGLAKVLRGFDPGGTEYSPPQALPIPPAATAFDSTPATRQGGPPAAIPLSSGVPAVAIPISNSATAIGSGSGSHDSNTPMAIAIAPDGTAFSKGTGKVITSREMEADLTQEGSVLGTPVYMPPEQATGRIHAIDQRSDVYSLGAILYELLALQAPISREGTFTDVILRVIKGEIVPPEWENRPRYRAGKIPLEVSAVAMKALANHPEDRYQTVEALRQDVELFLEGRSVSAKEDTRREQAVKFIKRNKAFSAAVAAALVLLSIVVTWSFRVNLKARRDAEKAQAAAEKAYENYEEEQREKEKRTRLAVPALVEVARRDADRRLFDKAMTQVKVALDYDPDNPDARLLQSQLLLVKQDFKGALADLEKYLKKKPADASARQLVKLCERTRPQEMGNLVHMASVLIKQDAPALAEGLLRQHGSSGDAVRNQLLELYRKRIEAAWPGQGPRLGLDKSGYRLAINGATDLSPLKDIPLYSLSLEEGKELKDLAPLKDMPLTALYLHNCSALTHLSGLKGLTLAEIYLAHCASLTDLSGLKGMPLKSFSVERCGGIQDLSPLAGAPLTTILLNQCGVRSLSALKGLPLTGLNIASCGELRDLSGLKRTKLTAIVINNCPGLRDLSPLKEMPLTSLNLSGCAIINDLSPLKEMRLKSLDLTGCIEVRDLSPLQGMPLETVSLTNCSLLSNLSGLKGLPLAQLQLAGCGKVVDLSPLKDMPLTSITLNGCGMKDLNVLRGMPLTAISLSGCPALTDLSALKGMPFRDLELKDSIVLADLTPLKGMPLNSLNLNNCAEIKDLSPLQGMPLNTISLVGCAKITSLGPLKDCPIGQIDLRGCAGLQELNALKGMKFNKLQLDGCASLTDLSGLKGVPLGELQLNGCNKLEDLSGLKGVPLGRLYIDTCERIHDLSPLQGMPLSTLSMTNCAGLQDLSPLKGIQCVTLNLTGSAGITDLSPLKGMPLTNLHLQGCVKIADLSPLKGMPITQLNIANCPVKSLSPLEGMPLTWLYMDKCLELHDLTPLEGLKLNEVRLPPQVKKGIEGLRKMKTLTRIDDRNTEQFWQQYDASQPKPK